MVFPQCRAVLQDHERQRTLPIDAGCYTTYLIQHKWNRDESNGDEGKGAACPIHAKVIEHSRSEQPGKKLA